LETGAPPCSERRFPKRLKPSDYAKRQAMSVDQPTTPPPNVPDFARPKPAASRRSGRSCPPYHPALHQLVEAKQAWANPLDDEAKAKGFLGWHQRGYLPHHDAPGVTQLVTFRLHDAMPASRRGEWELLLRIEDDRQRRAKLEAYLDRGLGECWLRQPRVAEIVEGALQFFDGDRCRLRAWGIMPNHVHVLLDVWETPLAELLRSWKGYTAREANKLLNRRGPVWEREYWDTRIRDEEHLRKALRYVESNPVKAKLVAEACKWPWGSARLRERSAVFQNGLDRTNETDGAK
jgi:putative transposase